MLSALTHTSAAHGETQRGRHFFLGWISERYAGSASFKCRWHRGQGCGSHQFLLLAEEEAIKKVCSSAEFADYWKTRWKEEGIRPSFKSDDTKTRSAVFPSAGSQLGRCNFNFEFNVSGAFISPHVDVLTKKEKPNRRRWMSSTERWHKASCSTSPANQQPRVCRLKG